MKTVKETLMYFVISIFLFTALSFQDINAQNNCIEQSQVGNAWERPALFGKPFSSSDDSYIWLNGTSENYDYWFNQSFTIDTWVYCNWSNSSTEEYVLLSAGSNNQISVINNFYRGIVILFKKTGSQWNIEVINRPNPSITNVVKFPISFEGDFRQKWKHVAFSYEKNTKKMKLYINGVYQAERVIANDLSFGYEYKGCRIGDARKRTNVNMYSNKHFKGGLVGFRLWKSNMALNDYEIAYIWDKAFFAKKTFSPEREYLYDKLLINMVSGTTQIYSLKPGISMNLVNIVRSSNNVQHPARPPRPHSLEVNGDFCDIIELSWIRGTSYGAQYVYRKRQGEDWTLLCRTTDESYTDNDPNLQAGVDYTYKVEAVWKDNHNELNLNNGYYHSLDNEEATVRLRRVPGPTNLVVTEDVNTNSNCNGVIRLQWDPVNAVIYPYFSSYTIEYRLPSSSWQLLDNNISNPNYEHNVSVSDYGKVIEYRVGTVGDNCSGFSNVVSGIANEVCTAVPFDVICYYHEGNINIEWDYNQTGPPLSNFRIFRSVDGGPFSLFANDINASDRDYVDMNASMCRIYKYKIQAYNQCGSSGVLSNESNEASIPEAFDDVLTYNSNGTMTSHFDGSKGYFNNKIVLEWTTNPTRRGSVTEYQIYRRKHGQSYTLLTTIVNNMASVYEDMSTEPNVLYEYFIFARGNCGVDEPVSDTAYTSAFRTTSGIVNGKITYAGGNAVPDVEVLIHTDEVNLARSLYFNGSNYLGGKYPMEGLFDNGISFECWIKPENMTGSINGIVSMNYGMIHVGLKNMRPYVALMNGPIAMPGSQYLMQIEADTTLTAGNWYHIACTYVPLAGYTKLYLNGELIGSSVVAPEDQHYPDVDMINVDVGKIWSSQSYWKGNIDEMRLWTMFKTQEEIQRDYRRIIAGNEPELKAYYRFDEGFGTAAYDISRAGQNFNKNHLDTVTDVDTFPQWSNQIPSHEQLRPTGITDQHGNYTARGIVYSEGGNVFSVTPMLGVHNFDPNNVILFIGDNSPVHNNVNFTDISSFRVTGKVMYENTNFPVRDAEIYISNQQVFDGGGNPVLTNQHGEFDIQVPIGENYIAVRKNNHEFRYNGQWPSPTANEDYPTFNFQDDVYGIEFWDITRVKVAGRFVGGDAEGNKTIGFGLSDNNIGVGEIELMNEQGFDIDFNDPFSNTDMLSFLTDTISGEFELFLLPEVYKINYVGNDYYEINSNDLGFLDLRNFPPKDTVSHTFVDYELIDGDTVWSFNTQEYEYNVLRNFIIYSEPVIIVYAEDEEELIGEHEIIVQAPESEESETVNLLEDSPFNYPVFEMGKAYDIKIIVQSEYTNYDGDEPVTDIVRVENASVTIANNLEITEPVWVFQTNSDGIVEDYPWFRAGLPNMNVDNTYYEKSYTKTLTITASHNGYDVQWAGNDENLFRAYVLGGVDEGGQNFVTYGPEIPTFILRDPPGTKSYSFLEQGSGYTVRESFNFDYGSGSNIDNKILAGVRFQAGGGLAGPVFEAETTSTYSGGLEKTNHVTKSGSFSTSYEFLQRFSTSNDPNVVGTMGDVFIGESMNMFFTQTTNLRILPFDYCQDTDTEYLDESALASDIGFTLGKVDGYAITKDESATMFIYSTDHIINNLIPTYIDMIHNTLATSPLYESNIPTDHPYYGTCNTFEIWKDTIISTGNDFPSYTFNGEDDDIDTVMFYNQQLSIWFETLAMNEKAKIDASLHVENVSFDGNSGPYLNQISYTNQSKERNDYSYKFRVFAGSATGFNVNKFGVLSVSSAYWQWERELGFETEETKTMTFGYVLHDDTPGDYYSVDVKMDEEGVLESDMNEFLNIENQDSFSSFNTGMGIGSGAVSLIGLALGKVYGGAFGAAINITATIGFSAAYLSNMVTYRDDIQSQTLEYGLCGASPVFRILGGRSACPYEGPEQTFLYHDPINEEPYIIHQGTQQREAPKIDIEPQTVINVPEGQPAVFELKLTNDSFTGDDFVYQLKVDEAANPHGAILKIDGLDPNRPFYVPAGTTLTKTLTVEQGAGGQLEYEDLQMIFHSSCQYNPQYNYPDIADSVHFTANFIPICSNVSFGNMHQNWIINNFDENVKTVHITDYNINYPTFRRILFQYQQDGYTPTTVMNFFNDTTGYADFMGPKMLINEEPDIYYDWDLSTLNDGNYSIMLKTICGNNSENMSDVLEGVIDRINPRPFGTPQPSDGILSYGDDISIRFNETINAGHLYAISSNIGITGITNGTDLVNNTNLIHDSNISFDGQNDYLLVSPGINLDHGSFTIEFWAKRNSSGRQCLLSLNKNDGNGLWVGFNENNKFVVELEGTVLESFNVHTGPGNWNHYGITYNKGNDGVESGLTIVIAFGITTEERYVQTSVFGSLEGPLFIGKCSYYDSYFHGNMHDLRIWNYYRTVDEISADKGRLLNGFEQGLYSYWPMNEASGDKAMDISFGRDAQMYASWQVSRNGKSLYFDGNSYTTAPTGSMVMSDKDDFSLEFWFKTNTPAQNQHIFSNGTGDVTENQHSWNIRFTPQATIEIINNAQTISVNAQNYLNNNWHHFAMTLNRLGYLSIYLNGNLIATHSASQFKGFAASQMVLGARWDNQYSFDDYDSFYTGYIDELRIWNNVRRSEQLNQYMNHALTGDEFGLLAYFPFEDTRIPDPSISNETLDNLTNEEHNIAESFELFGNAELSSESPNIRLQRPEVNIPFTYVINNDKVIINPNIDANLIENRLLNISIKNVRDMNGNQMSSTATWTAFVNRNNVTWELNDINAEKHVDDELIINISIRNKGGLSENFSIDNVPTWMEVSPQSGTLNPLQTREIQVKIKPELNVGNYSHDLHLVSSMNFNERLRLNIKVIGNVPQWTVNPNDYDYSASLIGQLRINNIISVDTDDIVACFVGNECRGVTKVQYLPLGDVYLLFMTVYSNQSAGEELRFKVYDASTGLVYTEVLPVLDFVANDVYGSISSPIEINAIDYIEQHFSLNQGWNWISFNVYSQIFENINLALGNLNAKSGDLIKNQTKFAQYGNKNVWIGSLNSLNYDTGYKLFVKEAQNFSVAGRRLIADTIQFELHAGWNLIGFPSQIRVPLISALSDVNPQNDDIIKSQYKFAVFSNLLGWVGSLEYLEPGEAYMINLATPGYFKFVENNTRIRSPEIEQKIELPATSGNMSIIADTEIPLPDNTVIQAYDNSVLCGYAKAHVLPCGNKRYFITINSEDSRRIVFKAVFDNSLIPALEIVNYSENMHLGSMEEPFILSFEQSLINVDDIFIYPNPFSQELIVNINSDNDELINVAISTVLGKTLDEDKLFLVEGENKIYLSDVFDISELSVGIYFISIYSNEREYKFKVVKQ